MSGKFYFMASDGSEEARAEAALREIHQTLELMSRTCVSGQLLVSRSEAVLLGWMLQLGSAHEPQSIERYQHFLDLAQTYDQLVISLDPVNAAQMCELMTRGIYRHKAGAFSPSSFRLH